MRDPNYRQMTEYLVRLGTTDVEHSGKGFLAHLIGVFNDLERWGCDIDVCRAGMFHSIYGTELFQRFGLPFERRGELQTLIGERAERLAFWNCVMDRAKWDAQFFGPARPRVVVNRITGETYPMTEQEFRDLATIHVCDWLEQVPRSEKWDYRREAYRAMATFLGGIALEEYEKVFTLAPEPAEAHATATA